MIFRSSTFVFVLIVAVVTALPAVQNKDGKDKKQLKLKLSSETDLEVQNLVEPDPLPPPPTTTTTTTTTDDSSSSSSSFPDREGFFTGHRIPIELFGEETKSRLLQEDALPHAEKKAYVDSSDFRSAGARVVALSETMEPPAHEPRFPPPSEVMLPPRPQPVLPSRRLPSREPLRPPPPSPQHFGGGGGFVLEGGIADQGSLLSTEKDPAYFGSLDAFVPPDFLQR